MELSLSIVKTLLQSNIKKQFIHGSSCFWCIEWIKFLAIRISKNQSLDKLWSIMSSLKKKPFIIMSKMLKTTSHNMQINWLPWLNLLITLSQKIPIGHIIKEEESMSFLGIINLQPIKLTFSLGLFLKMEVSWLVVLEGIKIFGLLVQKRYININEEKGYYKPKRKYK